MTEEEIKALQDAKDAAEKKVAEIEALYNSEKAEREKAKLDLSKVVDELKEERQKKNEALSKVNINNGEPDVNQLIEQALSKKESERRQAELEQAINEFKASKSEFQSDSAGLVFGKFQESLKRFNLSDITTKEQAKSRLEEIYKFVNFKENNSEPTEYEGTPQVNINVADKDGQLSRDTQAAIEMAGMDKEKFTKLSSKYGEALKSLGI